VSPSPRSQNWREALLWLTCANILLAYLQGFGYLRTAQLPPASLGWWFAAAALLAQISALCLLLGLLFEGAGALAGPVVVRPAAPLAFSLGQLLLALDRQIFALFRFHFNGLVWNVLTTPGGWESMHISMADIARGAVGAALLLAAEYALFLWIERRASSDPGGTRGVRRRWLALACATAVLMAAEKGVYAYGDLKDLPEILRGAKVVPLYQRFTMKKFARRYLGIQPAPRLDLRRDTGSGLLRYPRQPLRTKQPPKLYNIVWVALDGWRSDTFSRENTPNLWEFGERSQVFLEHLSGGNATRFGIFSMFYGLYGSYWHHFLSERRGPVLIDRLLELGYRCQVFSSTPLTFPEFRSTAFVRIPPDSIQDSLPGADAAARDAAMVESFERFLESRPAGKPFFAFLFTDSTHAGYYFPPEFARYRPYPETLEYLRLGSRTNPKEPFNRYRNAVLYSDYLIGRMLESLESRGLLRDTVVLVTGDHGEEFQEHGLWGHNGNFSREQIQVPLVLYIPGRRAARYGYRTSQLDLVPTFLEMLGVENPASDYSQGRSLFDPSQRPYAVSCSWDQCALVSADAALIFGTESYRIASVEVRDADYREVADARPILERHSAKLAQLLEEMSAFLK